MKFFILVFTLILTPIMAQSQDQQIKLHSSQESVALLIDLTNLSLPSTAPSNLACTARNGDQAQVIYQVASAEPNVGWLRIKMISGSCEGKEGWVSSEMAQAF